MGVGSAFYLPCGTGGKGADFESQTGLGLNVECHLVF